MQPIHISRDRQSLGQFSPQEVADGLKSGKFLPTDLAWHQGLDSWMELASLPGLPPPSGDIAPGSAAASGIPPTPGMTPPAGSQLPLDTPAPPAGPLPAWEKRQELGFFPAIFQTIRQVMLEPGRTFTAMPKFGGFWHPLLFSIILVWVGTFFTSIYQLVPTILNPAEAQDALAGAASLTVMYLMLGGYLVITPILTAFFTFLISGIVHLVLMLLGGIRGGFESTFRVLCYTQGGASVLLLLPICGGFIYPVWYYIITTIGLSKTHEIPVWKALLAILVPLLLCCGLLLGVVFAIGGGTAAFVHLLEQQGHHSE